MRAIISKESLRCGADGEDKRDKKEEKDLKCGFYPLQSKALPKYHHAKTWWHRGVRTTWFTVGLSLSLSPKAIWHSEDAALLVRWGEVLPSSCVKGGQRGQNGKRNGLTSNLLYKYSAGLVGTKGEEQLWARRQPWVNCFGIFLAKPYRKWALWYTACHIWG